MVNRWLQITRSLLSVDQGGMVGLSIAKVGLFFINCEKVKDVPNVMQFPAIKMSMKKSNHPCLTAS